MWNHQLNLIRLSSYRLSAMCQPFFFFFSFWTWAWAIILSLWGYGHFFKLENGSCTLFLYWHYRGVPFIRTNQTQPNPLFLSQSIEYSWTSLSAVCRILVLIGRGTSGFGILVRLWIWFGCSASCSWGRPREDFRFNLINSKNNDNDDASQGGNDNIHKIEYGIKIVFGDQSNLMDNK